MTANTPLARLTLPATSRWILTRDGPSLGGFVCPVTIAKAELWKVGQVKPGDRIRFYPISVEDAVAPGNAMDRSVDTLQTTALPEFVMPSLADRDGVSATGLVSLPATFSTPAIVYRQAGDNYILIEYGENVLDLALRLRVHVLMEQLRERAHPGIKELPPACVRCRCATTAVKSASPRGGAVAGAGGAHR